MMRTLIQHKKEVLVSAISKAYNVCVHDQCSIDTKNAKLVSNQQVAKHVCLYMYTQLLLLLYVR